MSIYDYLKSIAKADCLSYPDYIKAVLYHPELGYYRKNKRRVGYSPHTDFYTSSSINHIFPRLVATAARNLLGDTDELQEYTFVEIGAEPEESLLANVDHPFKEGLVFRVDDEINIPERAVVFSNELLDAQPFFRLVYKDSFWRERAICLKEGSLEEIMLDEASPELRPFIEMLPKQSVEGYQLDIPYYAETLFDKITQQAWNGLLMFFDYGLPWETLVNETPQGTARTYHHHKQDSDLIDNPGEKDITCHICWDRLESILHKNNFRKTRIHRQEGFFVHYATKEIERIITKNPMGFDPDKKSLQQLLHPSHMGAKFQVLTGMR